MLVLAQLFNCFNARSETTSAFHHLLVKPWLWGVIALSVLLQVAAVHMPLLNRAFGTAPLTPAQWRSVVALSVPASAAPPRRGVDRAGSGQRVRSGP